MATQVEYRDLAKETVTLLSDLLVSVVRWLSVALHLVFDRIKIYFFTKTILDKLSYPGCSLSMLLEKQRYLLST